MLIQVKTIKLTKSKILQMDFINIPKNLNFDVLGWVNINNKRYVIIKSSDCYYRVEFITDIIKEIKGVQFPLSDGGYEYPTLTNIRCSTYNRSIINYAAKRNEEDNIKLLDNLVSFKRKTEIAGQIYY